MVKPMKTYLATLLMLIASSSSEASKTGLDLLTA